MSKKSRKRNKKILAAIGLGLGAAAMASKRKADLASTEDGKSGSTKKPSIADVSGPVKKKSDSKMPSNISKDMGKDNKQVKKTTIKPFRAFDVSVPEGSKPLKLQDNSIRAKNRQTSSAGIKEPNKPMMASIFPKSRTADNCRANMQDFGRTNQYKSGGRANYKHGGSTGSSKSSGCEIKGTSPILMKGRK